MQQHIAVITENINSLGVELANLSPLSDNLKLVQVADKFNELAQSWKDFASADTETAENVQLLPNGAVKYDTFLGVICPMDENGAIVTLDGRLLQRNHVTQQALEIMFGKKQIEFQQKKNVLTAAKEKRDAELAEKSAKAQPEPTQTAEVKDGELTKEEAKNGAENDSANTTQPEPKQLLALPVPISEPTKPELSTSAAEVLKDLKAKPTLSFIKSYKADAADLVEVFKHLGCELPEHIETVEQMNLTNLKEAIANTIVPKK